MLRTVRLKTFIANLPVIGRYIYPFRNYDSPFHRKGYLHDPNTSYERNSSNSNAKVAIIGLPKSGNTWLTGLFSDYLNLPIVHYNSDYKKKGITMFHRELDKNIIFRKDIISTCYIIRDIRDVIVSYYHYAKSDDYRKYVDSKAYYDSIEDFYYNYFLSKIIQNYNWLNHTQKYVEHGVPLIKYENLFDNPNVEFHKLLLKMNIPIDKPKINDAVENNTLEKSKKGGKQFWRKIPTTHFRKGGYGGYLQELPEDIISDINVRFESFLKRWGYKI